MKLMKFAMPIMAVFALLVGNSQAQEKKVEKSPQVIKLEKNWENKPTALLLGTLKYRNKAGQEIHMHSAVHIAEKSYFEKKNKVFKKYDKVCYEAVKQFKDAPIVKHRKQGGFNIGSIQKFMSKMLGLTFQMDVVDYTPKNFVWADVTMEQLQSFSGQKKSKSQMAQTLRMYADLLDQMEEMKSKKGAAMPGLGGLNINLEDPETIVPLLTPNGRKRLLAPNLTRFDRMPKGMMKTLVEDRNREAMKVILEQVKNGHKKIAVFYGAAHMGDFHKRLVEAGFEYYDTDWDEAWNMRFTKDEIQIIMMLRMFKQQMQQIK